MFATTLLPPPCHSPNYQHQQHDQQHATVSLLVQTTRGKTASARVHVSVPFDTLVNSIWDAAEARDCEHCGVKRPSTATSHDDDDGANKKQRGYLVHQGKVLDESNYQKLLLGSFHNSNNNAQPATIHLRLRLRGGVDRQNRVGSKFGGGGVSSSQNAERERKDRLKRLALESIDLAKDPYLIRNHLGTYECKLCLTLHTNEANYLAHTQGKKHQQGLGRRAHLEAKKAERDSQYMNVQQLPSTLKPKPKRVKIGRPAYQVFKSRDEMTNQRCLSFEVTFPQTQQQPRHRFMSAFEQKVDVPANRNYQYLLVAAEPYETIAFKIPNEPIDKGEGRFVTHWNDDEKKFIITLYFMN